MQSFKWNKRKKIFLFHLDNEDGYYWKTQRIKWERDQKNMLICKIGEDYSSFPVIQCQRKIAAPAL